MDISTVLVAVTATVVLGSIAVVLLLRWRLQSLFLVGHNRRSLRVLNESSSCDQCRFWDREAGQNVMRSHPAFYAATAHLQPWQMGERRKVSWNDDYLKTEAELQEALKTSDIERQRVLHEKLLTINPGELQDPESYVDSETLKSTWAELGACIKHSELRMGRDGCERWEPLR